MRVEWLQDARKDLDSGAEYIARDSPAAAERFVLTILEAVDQLSRHPAIGRPGRVTGTRELVISGTPYVVPYRVRRDTVQVLRVFHGARQWPEKF